MRFLGNKFINIIFISAISMFYSSIFFITSGHIEFSSILYQGVLESKVLRSWAEFLKLGNQKYIALSYILITLIIVLIVTIKKQNKLDEFQLNILKTSLSIVGLFSLLIIPYILVSILSVPNGLLEAILLFATIQWFIVLFYELFYVINYFK